MKMIIGRNDPCPCGSGKKYKKCCQHKQDVISLEAARTDNLFRTVWTKFSEFMGSDAAGDAVAEGFATFLLPGIDGEQVDEIGDLAMDWVAFAYRTAAGTTLCQQFAAAGKDLTDAERELLRSWSDSAPGFFRVEAATGRECQLSRLPDGRVFPVQATGMNLTPGDLVSAWLLPVHAAYRFGYGVQELDPGSLAPLLHLVDIEMQLLWRQRPKATWEELYREHWPRLTDALALAMADGQNALRITLPLGPSVLSGGTASIDSSPNWQAVDVLIRQAPDLLDDLLDPEDVAGLLRLWWDGALALRPRVVGPNGWAAAVLYLYLRDIMDEGVTQAEVAERFGVSPATLGSHARKLAAALNLRRVDLRYVGLMDPVVRTYWRMYCLAAMNRDEELTALPAPERALLDHALRTAGRQLSGVEPAGPVMQAEELIDQAWEASGSLRTRLAEEALTLWPDAADAYVLLGQAAEARGNLREARSLFEAGVQAGERALGPEFFAECVGHFYGIVESRPYMRARAGLAGVLWALGEREAAAVHYEEMLRLNPGDNQGIRYLLAACYLKLGDDARLGLLLAQHADEATAAIAFTHALWRYRQDGPGLAADRLLGEAAAVNSHVPAYLLGEKRLPAAPPAYIDMGGELEAIGYTWDFAAGWKSTTGALEWLRSRLR